MRGGLYIWDAIRSKPPTAPLFRRSSLAIPCHDYLEPVYEQPCFLLIGNESQGLPEAYEAECDLLVKMPMLGRADSLNAAVAAAVMAFQVRASWRNR